jgi:hypothetical protein
LSINFRLSFIQAVSQKRAFVVAEFLLLQDKKMIRAADRTIIAFGCIVGFYIQQK